MLLCGARSPRALPRPEIGPFAPASGNAELSDVACGRAVRASARFNSITGDYANAPSAAPPAQMLTICKSILPTGSAPLVRALYRGGTAGACLGAPHQVSLAYDSKQFIVVVNNGYGGRVPESPPSPARRGGCRCRERYVFSHVGWRIEEDDRILQDEQHVRRRKPEHRPAPRQSGSTNYGLVRYTRCV